MSGVVAGQRLFVIEHVLRMHPDAAPQWEVAHGGQGAVPFHQHRVIITGRPSLSCSLDTAAGDETINHGFALVAMRLVNAIPIVHKAKTGILGQLEIARYSKHDWPIP